MRKKTTIRFTDNEKELLTDVAKYLHWTITEVLRRSLRYGINALLKFETNKEIDLKEFDKKRKPGQTTVATSGNPIDQDHKNNTKEKKEEKEQPPSIEEQIETFCILSPEEPREYIEKYIRSGTNKNYNDWKKENIK